jgi:hypothetical protein
MGMLQILEIVVVVFLIAFLVMKRKRDRAGTTDQRRI